MGSPKRITSVFYPIIRHVLYLALLFWACLAYTQASNKHMYNVQDFGIYGTENVHTIKINDLIAKVHQKGGGTIVFPAGEYLTGAIVLRSNINLVLEAGSVLRFSRDFNDYPFVETRWAGVECMGFSPLIYANGASNMSISGMGTIDGNAYAWWERQEEIIASGLSMAAPETQWEKELERLNRERDPGDILENFGGYWNSQFLRPPVIQFYDCTNVVIRDVTIINSPFWTVHPVYCDDVTIDNITIYNPPGTHNTDGINPESSRNVRISNCLIMVDDDCIAIKSGRDSDGRRVGIPSENIVITNCIFNRGYGGITIGSEMSGGVRNVVVSNCVFNGLDWAIRIKTQRGRGGVVEQVMMNNLLINGGNIGISINARYTDLPEAPVTERTPVVRNIRISEVIIQDTQRAGQILGLPEMAITDVVLQGMTIASHQGFAVEDAHRVLFYNIRYRLQEGRLVSGKNARVKIQRSVKY